MDEPVEKEIHLASGKSARLETMNGLVGPKWEAKKGQRVEWKAKGGKKLPTQGGE